LAGSWVLLLGVTLQMAAVDTKSFTRLSTGRLFTAAIHSVGVTCDCHRLYLDEEEGRRKPCRHEIDPLWAWSVATSGQEVR